jgi:phage terminase Nu1 subunit (DNA packaging protein)
LLHCVTLIEEPAKLAALQRRQREGELVPASEVHALWQQLAAFIKANAMSLPSKATPQLALLTRTGDEGGTDDGAGDEPRPTA